MTKRVRRAAVGKPVMFGFADPAGEVPTGVLPTAGQFTPCCRPESVTIRWKRRNYTLVFGVEDMRGDAMLHAVGGMIVKVAEILPTPAGEEIIRQLVAVADAYKAAQEGQKLSQEDAERLGFDLGRAFMKKPPSKGQPKREPKPKTKKETA